MQIDMPSMLRRLKDCPSMENKSRSEAYIMRLMGSCMMREVTFSEIDCGAFDEEDMSDFIDNNTSMESVIKIVDNIESAKPVPAAKRMFF